MIKRFIYYLIFFLGAIYTVNANNRSYINDTCRTLDYKVEKNQVNDFFQHKFKDITKSLSDGFWCILYENNTKFLEFHLSNGLISSFVKEYYFNGNISVITIYEELGLKKTTVKWGENGDVWKIIEYEEGVENKEFLFDNNFIVREINHYGKDKGTISYKNPKSFPKKYNYIIDIYNESKVRCNVPDPK